MVYVIPWTTNKRALSQSIRALAYWLHTVPLLSKAAPQRPRDPGLALKPHSDSSQDWILESKVELRRRYDMSALL